MRYPDFTDVITGATVYVDGELCGVDVEFQLPALKRKTVSYDTMGLEVPLPGRADASTLSIHKIGMDGNLYKLCMSGIHDYMLKWTMIYHGDGEYTEPVGAYCYIRGRATGVPEAGGKIGDSIDSTVEISPIIERIVIDGFTRVDINKLTGKFEIYGYDENENIDALL